MSKQKEIFQAFEGNNWFNRNKSSYEKTKSDKDLIIEIFKEIEINPKKILEIGCSNGMRLDKFHQVFGAECHGLDPSATAIENGKETFLNINLQVGTADNLPFADNSFDVIVFGFCLYLCDRNDLFKIAMEANRCLADNGFLAILDFYPPFPYKNIYTHAEGVFSYKMDYSKMFSWNPAYNEIHKSVFSHYGFSKRNIPNEKVAITILNKNETFAYPNEPYK
jgi:ubiquinone/menaquinone biosynthesis C-methylase UbiE